MSMFTYALPDVGEGLDQAEIISWKVEVGDSVVPDQVLADVETDKSIVEVPSPVSGIVVSLSGEPGDFIEVGSLFVEIEVSDESGSEENDSAPEASRAANDQFAADTAKTAVLDDGAEAAPVDARPSASVAGRTRVLASPATRRFAFDSGVDLALVAATGSQGRVTKADVLAHLAAAASETAYETGSKATSISTFKAPAISDSTDSVASSRPTVQTADESIPFRGLRRTIAANMVESWRTIPHITDFREVDATGLVSAREQVNDQLVALGRNEKITYLPFLVRAVAQALRQHKEFNSRLEVESEKITFFGRRNIGLAVSTGAGLFVPVIHDADSKLLLELSRESVNLAEKARNRSITSAEMSSGTFTITNFGSYGGWLGTPIIRPPEVAIAGFGRIDDKVIAVDGEPVVRKVLPLAVSADHRVIDGADMGEFLATLTRLLENPVVLMAGDI